MFTGCGDIIHDEEDIMRKRVIERIKHELEHSNLTIKDLENISRIIKSYIRNKT